MKKQGWISFLEMCAHLEDPEMCDNFFHLFLTHEERDVIASRYLIIQALLEGRLTQREIAKTYKVSIAQITRGSNALKTINPKLKEVLLKCLQH